VAARTRRDAIHPSHSVVAGYACVRASTLFIRECACVRARGDERAARQRVWRRQRRERLVGGAHDGARTKRPLSVLSQQLVDQRTVTNCPLCGPCSWRGLERRVSPRAAQLPLRPAQRLTEWWGKTDRRTPPIRAVRWILMQRKCEGGSADRPVSPCACIACHACNQPCVDHQPIVQAATKLTLDSALEAGVTLEREPGAEDPKNDRSMAVASQTHHQ
jgi:hypothetical protein